MGRYGTSEALRNKKLQRKAVNYGINKLTPFIQDSVGSAMEQLSTKVRPKKKYKTDRKDLDGRGITSTLAAPAVAMKTTEKIRPSPVVSNGLFSQKCLSMLIPYFSVIISGHVSGLDEIMLFISVKASGLLLKNVDLYCLKRFPSLLNAGNNSGLLPLRIIPFAFSSAVGRLQNLLDVIPCLLPKADDIISPDLYLS